MTVIDPFMETLSYKTPSNLYGAIWMIHDTDLPNFKDFFGISLHESEKSRKAFAQRSSDADKKKYGNKVPDTYFALRTDASYRNNAFLEMIASSELTDYVYRESLGREVNGVFLTAPTVMLLPRMGFITKGETSIELLVEQYKDDYRPELMTPRRFFDEVSEDTNLWYQAQN